MEEEILNGWSTEDEIENGPNLRRGGAGNVAVGGESVRRGWALLFGRCSSGKPGGSFFDEPGLAHRCGDRRRQTKEDVNALLPHESAMGLESIYWGGHAGPLHVMS